MADDLSRCPETPMRMSCNQRPRPPYQHQPDCDQEECPTLLSDDHILLLLRCDGQATVSVLSDKIYEPGIQCEVFQFYRDLRNKHFAHDENGGVNRRRGSSWPSGPAAASRLSASTSQTRQGAAPGRPGASSRRAAGRPSRRRTPTGPSAPTGSSTWLR